MDIESILSLIEYLFPIVLGIVTCVVTFVRTGKIKSINNTASDTKKEIEDMKYRLANYRETEKPVATKFETEVPQYRLNKQTGELVELPVKKNLQEQLNSFRDVALTDVIERFIPITENDRSSVFDSPVIDAYNYNADRLDALLQASEFTEELRQKYNYSDEMTLSEIIADLEDKNKKIVEQINKSYVKELNNESEENVEKK